MVLILIPISDSGFLLTLHNTSISVTVFITTIFMVAQLWTGLEFTLGYIAILFDQY